MLVLPPCLYDAVMSKRASASSKVVSFKLELGGSEGSRTALTLDCYKDESVRRGAGGLQEMMKDASSNAKDDRDCTEISSSS